MSADHRSRHLSCDALRDHLDNRMPMLIPVEGDPPLYWHLEAGGLRPALRIPVPPGTKAPRLGMQGIRAVCVLDGGEQFLHVFIEQTKLLREFHIVCCEIADRIQMEGVAPVAAVQTTVMAWRKLLARGRQMSLEEEIGLFGELLTLIGLAAARGWHAAVDAWQSPKCADHDFTVGPYDIEVKTVGGRARVHTIHGLTQLEPHRDRPLWFVSHMVEESDAGRTVLGLIEGIRSIIRVQAPGVLDDFDARRLLVTAGGHAIPREHRWAPVEATLAFPVDADFPRLTESILAPLPESLMVRIVDIDYRIDVADLIPSIAPSPDGLDHTVDLRTLPPDVASDLSESNSAKDEPR
ncbi:PD-(D/E)XK motif protein [Embleya scabrispora]|uniref:PD-(D/E)XK motif protein n=1 Tax=Embleya scabrispora TaxID=159449 RepID=UPI00037CB089|nr:PD-(D/E)XK motif protein [Embleya scabrispora]MYS78756.1 PD-(D/E)XK motif protein [Streptomyces sp. SID5474]